MTPHIFVGILIGCVVVGLLACTFAAMILSGRISEDERRNGLPDD